VGSRNIVSIQPIPAGDGVVIAKLYRGPRGVCIDVLCGARWVTKVIGLRRHRDTGEIDSDRWESITCNSAPLNTGELKLIAASFKDDLVEILDE
jgi:hypothetical protein